MVRLTDRPDMTLDVYRGRKTTIQYNTIQYDKNWRVENEMWLRACDIRKIEVQFKLSC